MAAGRPSQGGEEAAKLTPRQAKAQARREARARQAGPRGQPSPEALAKAKERLSPPKAPWHPLPLAELGIVLGFVGMLVALLLNNVTGAAAAFSLVILATVEFSWREHRHGFRSHGAVIGGTVAFVVAMVGWRLGDLNRNTCIVIGLVVFFSLWGLLTKTYVPREDREPPAGGTSR